MVTRSKYPATAADPRLRVTDPRWPEGPKPGTIMWGDEEGRTTRLHFHVAKDPRDAELRVEASQVTPWKVFGRELTPRKVFKWELLKPSVAKAHVVNPTNMGITSRLTDLYDAVRQLDLTGLEGERLSPDYRAKPGELAIRLHGRQLYYRLDPKSEQAQALFDAARGTLLGIAVGEGRG